MKEASPGAPYLEPSAPPAGHAPFVSRSEAAAALPTPGGVDADGRPLPRLRDRGTIVLLALVAALQGFSWSTLAGYQLADSVEYMERAQAFCRAEIVIDSQTIRSFGFSAVLVPFFWVADLLGVEDFTPVVWLIRCAQMALGLGLVLVCVRIGAKLGGRRVGFVAGYLVGVNPMFLQYSVSPLSDIAAALCMGLAVQALIERGGFRRGLTGGLWLGGALLMAYKTIPLSAAVVLMVLIRDRHRHLRYFGGIVAGGLVGVGAQLLLDRIIYRDWGASLYHYVLANVGGIMGRVLLKLGLDDLAWTVYDAGISAAKVAATSEGNPLEMVRLKYPPEWYVTHLPQMLVWPILAFGAFGLFRCVKRMNWISSLLLLAILIDVAILSQKGAKDYRLWLPLLPMIAPICAWGWEAIRGRPEDRPAFWRPLLTTAMLVGALVLGLDRLVDRNTRKFSGYWRAIEMIEDEAATLRDGNPDAPKVKVASAYHWGVYLRESSDIELTKLPHQITGWEEFEELAKRQDLEVIVEQDWFIVHRPALTNPAHVDLMRVISKYFAVYAVLWERDTYEDLGPVYVLRKRAEPGVLSPGELTFFDVFEDRDVDEYMREHRFEEPARFLHTTHQEEIWFLGFEYEQVRGDDFGWITYHYYNAGPHNLADYEFIDRLTTTDERRAWQNNHAPAYRVHPTNTWEAGWIIRESYPVYAAQDVEDLDKPFLPIGGAYRRGDYMPAYLWLDITTRATDPETGEAISTDRMKRARFGADGPIRVGPNASVGRAQGGFRWSGDNLSQVGRFFLPVHPHARLADDGRPIPD